MCSDCCTSFLNMMYIEIILTLMHSVCITYIYTTWTTRGKDELLQEEHV